MEGFTLFKPPRLKRLEEHSTMTVPYELAYHGVYKYESYEEDVARVLDEAAVAVCLDHLFEETGVGRESYGLDLQYSPMFVPRIPLRPRRWVWLGFYAVAAGHLRVMPEARGSSPEGGWYAEPVCKGCGSTGGHRDYCPDIGRDVQPVLHLRVDEKVTKLSFTGNPPDPRNKFSLNLMDAQRRELERFDHRIDAIRYGLYRQSGYGPPVYVGETERVSSTRICSFCSAFAPQHLPWCVHATASNVMVEVEDSETE